MNKVCERYTGLIVKAAYSDASFIERIKVYLHLRKCKICKNLYNEHKIAAKALQQLPEYECPAPVIEKVQSVIGEKQTATPSFIIDFYSIFERISVRKIAGGLIIIILVVAFAILYRQNYKSLESKKYTKAQIEKANIQAQQALIIIGNVINSTQAKLEKEILPEKVSKPINKSFYVISDLFKSGDKNESN